MKTKFITYARECKTVDTFGAAVTEQEYTNFQKMSEEEKIKWVEENQSKFSFDSEEVQMYGDYIFQVNFEKTETRNQERNPNYVNEKTQLSTKWVKLTTSIERTKV